MVLAIFCWLTVFWGGAVRNPCFLYFWLLFVILHEPNVLQTSPSSKFLALGAVIYLLFIFIDCSILKLQVVFVKVFLGTVEFGQTPCVSGAYRSLQPLLHFAASWLVGMLWAITSMSGILLYSLLGHPGIDTAVQIVLASQSASKWNSACTER